MYTHIHIINDHIQYDAKKHKTWKNDVITSKNVAFQESSKHTSATDTEMMTNAPATNQILRWLMLLSSFWDLTELYTGALNTPQREHDCIKRDVQNSVKRRSAL